MKKEKRVDPKKIPAVLKIVVCLAHNKFNTALANEIANNASSLASTAETYGMVKVCLESNAVYKTLVSQSDHSDKGEVKP